MFLPSDAAQKLENGLASVEFWARSAGFPLDCDSLASLAMQRSVVNNAGGKTEKKKGKKAAFLPSSKLQTVETSRINMSLFVFVIKI